MNTIKTIQTLLTTAASLSKNSSSRFFKTDKGGYAEHDIFINVPVPELRRIAKLYAHIPLSDLQILLNSSINEARLLCLIILTAQYKKADEKKRHELYTFYVNNLERVNNWNLVDSSAHLIIGAHLATQEKDLLFTLAKSNNLWKRRIAIVATWYFIRINDLSITFALAKELLNDTHDLMHKAVGWMLREAGKRNPNELVKFLDEHASYMPRTMLRYAIEKFDQDQRKSYLSKKK
jgi:3-methyladenine DNA glycosylase AlkD